MEEKVKKEEDKRVPTEGYQCFCTIISISMLV